MEGMGLCLDVEVLASHLHADLRFSVREVAGSDDETLTLTEDNERGLAVFTSSIGNHLCAWYDEIAEMLVGIVLRGVAHVARLAVHLNQRVLCPAPSGLPLVGQDEVPVVVLITSIAQIV